MRLGRAGLVVAVVLAAAAAGAAEPVPARLTEKVWRVGVFESPPYAMRGADGEWRGLAIDLWKEIAAEKNLHYRLGEASPDVILDDIAHDRLDMSVAPFAATVDRQRLIDFSHAFLSIETGIAVRRGTDEDRWIAVARALSTPSALRLYAGITALTFLAGAAVWLLERRRNPQFSGGTLSGIGSGFWWSGRDDGGRRVRRQGADHVLGTDRGPLLDVRQPHPRHRVDGLRHRQARLGRVRPDARRRGSAQRRRRHGRGIGGRGLPPARADPPEGLCDAPAALDALADRQVGAVVYGADVLSYYVERDPKKRFEILPGNVRPSGPRFPDARPAARCASPSTTRCGAT